MTALGNTFVRLSPNNAIPSMQLQLCGLKKKTVSRLDISAAIARQTPGWRQARLVWARRQRLFVAGVVVEDAAGNDGHVLGKVEGGGDDQEGEQQEEDRV
jgi:hypothetical protein